MIEATDPRRTWRFRWRLGAARAAAAFEQLWPALWPILGVVGLFLVISLFGGWAWLAPWLHALGLVLFAGALLWALTQLRPSLAWPDAEAGLGRLERVNRLPHQPLRALGEELAAGRDDPISRSLWRRHQDRLRQMVGRLQVGLPRSDLPRRDRWALRAALLLLLVVALVEAGGSAPQRLLAAFDLGRPGGAIERPVEFAVWVTPPAYTGRPPMALEAAAPPSGAEVTAGPPVAVSIPAGSEVLAQIHHLTEAAEQFALSLDQATEPFASVGDGSASAGLTLERSGELRVGRPGETLGAWLIEAIPDRAPAIELAAQPAVTQRSVLRFAFNADDDYGIGSVALLLARPGDEANAERIELMRPASGVTKLSDAAYQDLTAHPWAGLTVAVQLEAVDAIDQRGRTELVEMILPEREFHHPVARAIIEQRRTLANDPEQRPEVAAALNRLARLPEMFQNDMAVYMALRSSALRLTLEPSQETMDDVMSTMWDTALHLEDGSLSLAARELRDLQQALRDALAEGASDEELERLMNELQRALENYLEALASQAQEQAGDQQQQIDPNAIEVERQDLQQMLDAMRDMIRTGARDAAQQMLAQLQELLENLQVGQSGQMQQGEQMLNQLQEMIQRQQELLDRTFGMSRQQGQPEMQNRPGQPGQEGEGEDGQQQMGQMGGMQPGGQSGQAAMDQESLRRALGELMRGFGESGVPLPRALGEAELSMRQARDALQQGQPGNAVDPQSQALDQLRQGGQAMMQEMQRMMGQGEGQIPGQQFGQSPSSRDPLGRSLYNMGGPEQWGTEVPEQLELGRARSILEELYRRARQRERPAEELDYLQRLLDRF
jgi:uncharacterized protein (TIGR02302 family)